MFTCLKSLTVQIGEENTQGYGQMTPYKFF